MLRPAYGSGKRLEEQPDGKVFVQRVDVGLQVLQAPVLKERNVFSV